MSTPEERKGLLARAAGEGYRSMLITTPPLKSPESPETPKSATTTSLSAEPPRKGSRDRAITRVIKPGETYAAPEAKQINLSVHIKDFLGVNGVEGAVVLQMTVTATWKDPALINRKSRINWEDEFDPELEIFNSLKMKKETHTELVNAATGEVKQRIHFWGSISNYMDLRNFPFDEDNVFIIIRSARYTNEEAAIHMDPQMQKELKKYGGAALIGSSMSVGVQDWKIGVPSFMQQTLQKRDTGAGSVFNQIVISIPIKRRASYYIWKFFLVLFMLLIISFFTFSLEPEQFADKMVINLTLFLSIVAFFFVLDKSVPKVPYLTFAEKVIIGEFVWLFLIATESFIVYEMVHHDSSLKHTAKKIDNISLVAFPVCYLLFLSRQIRELYGDSVWANEKVVFPEQTTMFRGRLDPREPSVPKV